MKKNNQIVKQDGFKEFLIYTTPNGKVKIEIFLHNGNIWLTQAKIANLFGVQQPAIAKHLKNIFETRELEENSVHSILEYTATDGKTYKTKFYNLDAIISVGYRVNSTQATHFRIWATKEIKKLERTISGFFDYIENLIENRQAFTMAEFAEGVNKFLSFNEYKILAGKGKISHTQAENKALAEYAGFNKSQSIESDFDRDVKKLLKKNRNETHD
ncbi:MAG: RhuM family protein [Candidatus Roizmanbacteria bacterium]|nr:RhuM family protein [Candidatus Roizmanbacteria bacterium]